MAIQTGVMRMNKSNDSIDLRRTGLKLQKLTRQNGYSVKDIQKYLCLSCPQPVDRWFKGSILPSVDNLLRLSELFHVHMEELLVKMHSDELFEEIIFYTSDSQMFCRGIKAYYLLLSA